MLLKGKETDGRMVLTGSVPARGGSNEARVTWTAETPDCFVQLWETTEDGGATWQRLLKVRYTGR